MIETTFEALSGLRYSGGNIIALIAFFGMGFLFGKLTRNMGLIKGFFALIFGFYFYVMLKDAYGAIILAFLIGVASNHVNFFVETVLWAQDIQDIWFAHKYRKAFEDIKQQEQAQARKEAYEQQRTEGESQRQREWRKQAQQESPHSSQKKDSTSSGGGAQREKNPHNAYYRTMGLDPDGTYTKADLKRAYHRQAKKAHPDVGGTKEGFQQLSNSYEALLKAV
jgi:acyl-CoA synthetase (AMP-forming)/AMP-acid ligase II